MSLTERRVRRVPISNQFLTALLQGVLKREPALGETITSDLPVDARIVHVAADFSTDSVVVYMESIEWDPVEDGVEIPLFIPKFTVERTA